MNTLIITYRVCMELSSTLSILLPPEFPSFEVAQTYAGVVMESLLRRGEKVKLWVEIINLNILK